jgi:hypothetical protein
MSEANVGIYGTRAYSSYGAGMVDPDTRLLRVRDDSVGGAVTLAD